MPAENSKPCRLSKVAYLGPLFNRKVCQQRRAKEAKKTWLFPLLLTGPCRATGGSVAVSRARIYSSNLRSKPRRLERPAPDSMPEFLAADYIDTLPKAKLKP